MTKISNNDIIIQEFNGFDVRFVGESYKSMNGAMSDEEKLKIAEECLELAADMVGYVPEYFIDKWGYVDDLLSLKARISEWKEANAVTKSNS